jgi:delta-aminolevulinic acid dehydratase/porphobilinogen synthase
MLVSEFLIAYSSAPPGRLHAGYSHPVMRSWHVQSAIQASDLVYPMFVTDDHLDCEAIPSLPGQYR